MEHLLIASQRQTLNNPTLSVWITSNREAASRWYALSKGFLLNLHNTVTKDYKKDTGCFSTPMFIFTMNLYRARLFIKYR
jgi:hypothetical protein